MRVLISAYACEPGKGSEGEVGLRIALVAASVHEVWVVTRENNLRSLENFLQDHPQRDRIHLIGLDVGGHAKRFKRRGGLLGLHWYYDKWQRRLEEVAVSLDAQLDFDVVHHATFATYWTRTGVSAVNKPFVWGPVGGGVKPPARLLTVMGLKGAIGDLIRVAARPVLALLTRSRRIARRASVVLVQNPETAVALGVAPGTRVLPNALAIASAEANLGNLTDEPNVPTKVLSVGRLIPLKGTVLALEAMAGLEQEATLFVYGDGPERTRLSRQVTRLRIQHAVRFMGNVDRERLLADVARSDVLVHVALHDEAPLAVAEALAVGTPVVMLNRGGPPVIARYWPETPVAIVEPSTREATAREISARISALTGVRGLPDTRPAALFSEKLLEAYQEAVSGFDP